MTFREEHVPTKISDKDKLAVKETDGAKKEVCSHKNVTTWNHGYHSLCRDCGEKDVW